MKAGLPLAFFAVSVYLFTCFWYLCAPLREDPEASWIAERGIPEQTPEYQYSTSDYVVVTVFTTVGLGDVNAKT
eukprot:16451049-Heterocapsa_arctica.AAC.2